MTDDNKLPLATPNPADDLLAQLRESAPQIFSEGKIDLDKFKAALGEHIDPRIERYGLNWAGKSEAFRNVQQPSVGTLLPQPDESVDWDSTENLILEGDNLEVLKLLQKPYHGKVKMIYIDPPYNTGNEFIYPDNYREGLDDYLRYSGQVSEAGIKQSTNTETSGRFHSKWLNMMYPRLFLARNLLRDDGVIFVSIDDNEVHNLRMLMNEVFGEESFVAQLTWKSRKYPDSRAMTGVSTDHEYVLIYHRVSARLRGIERDETKFSNPDNDPRGPWMSRSILGLATVEQRPNLHYTITDPDTGRTFDPPADTGWRYSQDRMNQLIASKSILFPNKHDGRPREKKFRADMQSELIAFPSIIDDVFTADGTADIRSIFGADMFDFSKPSELIRKLITQGADDQSIVLDFFAGSGTTAQAVLEQNAQDACGRKYILVQLPEKTDNPQYPTIADITRERVRRVIAKLNQADEGQLNLEGKVKPDRGFRAFKLSSSNFKIWDAAQASTEPDQLALQLQHYTDNVDDARTRQDILFELILKAGLPLAAKVEQVKVEGKPVFSVAEGQLLICLENPITQAVLRGMMALEPQQILCLDTAFHGNDPLKTNAVLEARSHGITFRTV
ncbi:MAG: site-specific DNA-methyltransferase [Sulfuricella sp.]